MDVGSRMGEGANQKFSGGIKVSKNSDLCYLFHWEGIWWKKDKENSEKGCLRWIMVVQVEGLHLCVL